MTTKTYPTGRSDYNPATRRMHEPSPQLEPDLFSKEDLVAEAKYLLKLNKKFGSNPLRTMAYMDLLRIAESR